MADYDSEDVNDTDLIALVVAAKLVINYMYNMAISSEAMLGLFEYQGMVHSERNPGFSTTFRDVSDFTIRFTRLYAMEEDRYFEQIMKMSKESWRVLYQNVAPVLTTIEFTRSEITLIISKEEKLHIAFMHWAQDYSYSILQYEFGLSSTSIQKLLEEVYEALMFAFYDEFMGRGQPYYQDPATEYIPKSNMYPELDPRMSPYRHFKGCLGYFDGTHIKVALTSR